MDFSLFENQPFYSNSCVEGENLTQEYQLWNINGLDISYDHDTCMFESTKHKQAKILALNIMISLKPISFSLKMTFKTSNVLSQHNLWRLDTYMSILGKTKLTKGK